jgi:hypothetical protein
VRPRWFTEPRNRPTEPGRTTSRPGPGGRDVTGPPGPGVFHFHGGFPGWLPRSRPWRRPSASSSALSAFLGAFRALGRRRRGGPGPDPGLAGCGPTGSRSWPGQRSGAREAVAERSRTVCERSANRLSPYDPAPPCNQQPFQAVCTGESSQSRSRSACVTNRAEDGGWLAARIADTAWCLQIFPPALAPTSTSGPHPLPAVHSGRTGYCMIRKMTRWLGIKSGFRSLSRTDGGTRGVSDRSQRPV